MVTRTIYEGPAWGIYEPQIFSEFMTGDFKQRLPSQRGDTQVNVEQRPGVTIFHVLPLGVGVCYALAIGGERARVDLVSNKPSRMSTIEKIITDEQRL